MSKDIGHTIRERLTANAEQFDGIVVDLLQQNADLLAALKEQVEHNDRRNQALGLTDSEMQTNAKALIAKVES